MVKISYPDKLPSSIGSWNVYELDSSWSSPLGSEDKFFIPWGREDARMIVFDEGNKFVVNYAVPKYAGDYRCEWYGGTDNGRFFFNRLHLSPDSKTSCYDVLCKNGETGFYSWLTPKFIKRCKDRLGVTVRRYGTLYTAPIPCFDEMRKMLRLTHGIQIELKHRQNLPMHLRFGYKITGTASKSAKLVNGELCEFGSGKIYKDGQFLCELPNDQVHVIVHSPVWTDIVGGF